MMGLLLQVVYSAVLLGIAGVVIRELWIVWADPQIYIGNFDVVSATGKDTGASESFPQRVVAAQTILARQLQDYQTRRGADAANDTTFGSSLDGSLSVPREAFGGIDITVQSINLKQVLTALRKGFTAPNELNGSIVGREGSYMAIVEWPRAPTPAGDWPEVKTFRVPLRSSIQEVASYVACTIAWARSTHASAVVRRVSRAQYCDFIMALDDLYGFEEAASTKSGLDDRQVETVRKRVGTLRSHYDAPYVYPDLYRLRADLLDLLPERERKVEDLDEAQADRLLYAMQGDDVRKLPVEERHLLALVLARPAFLLENSRPKDVGQNWAGLLKRNDDSIAQVAAATGILVDSEGKTPGGTGFIVAPELVMTTDFVLERAGYTYSAASKTWTGPKTPARFCPSPDASTCGAEYFQLGKVVHDGHEKTRLMLVELDRHDHDQLRPVPLADAPPAANEITGKYAYVVGYAYRAGTPPAAYLNRLVGPFDEGRKHLMPGRILAFGRTGLKVPWDNTQPVFTTDISTTSGTAGGPLVDLQSGKVLGVSVGGRWRDDRGKFALAAPIPAEAMEIIQRRIKGDPDPKPAAPPSAPPDAPPIK